MEQKLNTLKFGIAGGIIGVVSVLLAEVFLWIKYVPYYNNLMQNVYGTIGLTTLGVLKIIFISAIVAFVFSFLMTWLFAWIYNKLLMVKVN